MNLTFRFPPRPQEEAFRPNLNVILMCPECNDNNIIEEFSSGDMVCGDCGLVLGDRIIDTRSEWRTFGDNDGGHDPCRVGAAANPLLDSSQLDTIISSRDGHSGKAKELTRVQTKSTSKTDHKLLGVYNDIDTMGGAIGLPKTITDIAKQIYKKIEDFKAVKNRFSTQSIIAACIFIACRKVKVPRTFNEICALTKVPKNDIGRVYKAIEKVLVGVGNDESAASRLPTDMLYAPAPTTNSSDLLHRFCNRLRLSPKIEAMCTVLASRIDNAGTLAGRSPTTAAAAGIYLISHLTGNGKSRNEISEAACVSESTLKSAYKLLFASRMELVDPEWIKNGQGSIEKLPRS